MLTKVNKQNKHSTTKKRGDEKDGKEDKRYEYTSKEVAI